MVDPSYLLGWNSPQPSAQRVSLQNTREEKVFITLHCLALLRPLDKIWFTLLGEISQGTGDLRKCWDEPTIVTSQPQQPLHLLFGPEMRAACSGCGFLHLRMQLPASQVVPQIPYLPLSNRTLLHVGLVPCLPQGLQGCRPPAAYDSMSPWMVHGSMDGHPARQWRMQHVDTASCLWSAGKWLGLWTSQWKCDHLEQSVWTGEGHFFVQRQVCQ